MKSIRGNTSNFASLSNLLNKVSIFRETHQINGCDNLNLLRIRLFSSFDGSNRNRQGRRNPRNDFNDNDVDDDYNHRNFNKNDNDKCSGRNRGDFNSPKSFGNHGYNANAGRQRGQFGGNDPDYRSPKSFGNHGYNDNAGRKRDQFGGNDPDYRSRERRVDGFGKRVGGGEKGRTDFRSSDDGLKFDDKDGDIVSENQPSVRELLKGPVKEDNEFLEKFKLGGGENEEESRSEEGGRKPIVSEEEKVEAPEEAEEIFNKMKKSGLIPNAVAMLDGLCKDGLVHEAMKLFGVMREKGTMPEVVVYTAVVEGFCKANKLDDAMRIFKKMQDNGIVPNAFSYGVLVSGLCKGKRLEEAVDFCLQMLEAGHSPNVPTFTGLVHEFCKEKGLEDAKKVIVSLKQKGFFLDEKEIRVYYDKNGPTSPEVWEAIFGPKKSSHRPI